jgi:flagellar motor switch protein FliN/FliY
MRHPGPKSKNLDALVDVPLTVRVELGSIKRKVKEILEFNTGTLIELDQNVNQAVKLVVNNTTIASGTVIELKGHFGVRIEQIDDKAQFIKE